MLKVIKYLSIVVLLGALGWLAGCRQLVQVEFEGTDSGKEVIPLPQAVSITQIVQDFIHLKPLVTESIPAIGADYVHNRYGITGKDIGILIIDDFDDEPDAHGKYVQAIAWYTAPGARFYYYDLDKDERGFFSAKEINEKLEAAYQYVDEYGIKVINLSFGGGIYTEQCSILDPKLDPLGAVAEYWIKKLVGIKLVTVVVAAGNDANPWGVSSPACLRGVISVGAVYDQDLYGTYPFKSCTDVNPRKDQVVCYSNGGPLVSIWAPGSVVNIPKSNLAHGTSAAAPHVTGAVALLLEAARMSPEGVSYQLQKTGKPIIDFRNGLPGRRLDVREAIEDLLGLPPVDSDGDGIPDDEDKCPNEAGPRENNGCPLPPTEKSIPEALDRNGNSLLDDTEILEAVNYWITGQDVPGTGGKRIDDAQILYLIKLWIEGEPWG